jgi:hypothetical protein
MTKLAATLILILYIALRFSLGITCPIRQLTGIACPGCGMTRATLAVLRFDISTAWSYHFAFWSPPLLWLFFMYDGRLFKSRRINTAVLAFVALVFLANWVRNMFFPLF